MNQLYFVKGSFLKVYFVKGNYPYKYLDDWGKLKKTSLNRKTDFYSHLNMEDITDADYMRPRNVCKDFSIKIYR